MMKLLLYPPKVRRLVRVICPILEWMEEVVKSVNGLNTGNYVYHTKEWGDEIMVVVYHYYNSPHERDGYTLAFINEDLHDSLIKFISDFLVRLASKVGFHWVEIWEVNGFYMRCGKQALRVEWDAVLAEDVVKGWGKVTATITCYTEIDGVCNERKIKVPFDKLIQTVWGIMNVIQAAEEGGASV